MEYKELAELYHRDTTPQRESNARKELTQRLSADSTFRCGYTAREGELFVAVPRGLALLDEKVLRAERAVSKLMDRLPGIAQAAVLRGLVLDEVVSTNAIESVHSTKRQVKIALEASDGGSLKERRFRELARLYLGIVGGRAELPESPEDIRAIYDRIMEGELAEEDKPDGKLFRSGGVSVTNGVRTLHTGLEPESEIVQAIQAMLKLASSQDVPAVYSAIASHFLFEYAHPFYDGNGRTGRYLLALYLSEPLSTATSLSLSRTIYEHKSDYYKAFASGQNPLNHGELTHFVYGVLKLVSIAQDGMIERLRYGSGQLDDLERKLETVTSDEELKPKESDALFMLMQYEAFGYLGDASLSQIARHLRLGEQMARRYLKNLEGKGLVERVRRRDPVAFGLTESFKQKYGVTPVM